MKVTGDNDYYDAALLEKLPAHNFELSLIVHLLDLLGVPDSSMVLGDILSGLRDVILNRDRVWKTPAIYVGGFQSLRCSIFRHVFSYQKSIGMSVNGIAMKYGLSASVVNRGIKSVNGEKVDE